MRCRTCSLENPAANRFCENCGAQMPLMCRECGHTVSATAHFCGHCGTPLDAAAAAVPPAPAPIPPAWGELKQATVLFADIVSSTELIAHLDPEQAMERLRPAVDAMCEAVQRFDGTIIRTLGDGILAMFGAPQAQEGHALLACEAALAIQAALSRKAGGDNLMVRVGLHTGEVVADAPMADLTRERGVHGLTIHLASRVQTLAEPGTVYLSGDCQRLVHSHCDTAPLGTHALRGVPEPVPIYRLIGLKPIAASQAFRGLALTSFRGRAQEMAILQRALPDSGDLPDDTGEARVIGIAGPPGTGKSRLCHEFAEHCRGRGVPVFEARAQIYGHATPLQPVRELLRSLFFRTNPIGGALTTRGRILERLEWIGLEFTEDLGLVCEFLGVPLGDHPPSPLQPRARRARLLEITGRMVRHSGAATSVIVIEDLHWLDDASEEFVASLVNVVAGTRAMLVVNYRPSYTAAWMQDPGFQQIALGDLGASDTEALVGQLIGSRPELSAIRQRIAERSGGNPFFAEELIRSLAENGSLFGRPGDYRLGMSVGGPALPATVQAVIGARIDRLDETDKQVLQTGAIMGKEFPLGVLQKISQTPPLVTEGALDRLCEAGLLRPQEQSQPQSQPGSRERGYEFRHPLIQEVAYNTQLRARRATLHAAVASALEDYYRDRLDEFAGLLAYHYESAGRFLGAAHYGARAASWVGRTSSAQAVRQWHKVRQLLRDQPRSRESDPLRIMASGQIAFLGWREGMASEEAQPFIQEALGWARETDDSMIPLLLFAEARILGAAGGPADAYVERVRHALAMLSSTRGAGHTVILNASLSQALGWAGLWREALAANDSAMAGMTHVDSAHHEFLGFSVAHWVLSLRGRILSRLGRMEEAQRCLDEMLAIDPKLIDPTVQFIAHLGYVDMAWYRGDARLARLHADHVGEIARRHGSPYLRVYAYACAGIWKSLARDFAGAEQDLRAGLAVMHEGWVALNYEGEMLAILADCHYQAAQYDLAIETARRTVDLARQRNARLPESRALIIHALAMAGRSGPSASEEAGILLGQAEELIRLTGADIYAPLLTRARMMLSEGVIDPHPPMAVPVGQPDGPAA